MSETKNKTLSKYGGAQSRDIIVQSVDPEERFDSIEYDGNNSQMNNSSFIPKPSGFAQLQALREQNAASFNDTTQNNSKGYFDSARNESVGIDIKCSP